MTIRSFAVRAGAVAAVATAALVATAGVSAAAPYPTPKLGFLGDDIWVVGDNALCAGAIHLDVETDPTRPGSRTVVLTSRGMRGQGPAWDANPVCSMPVTIAWMDGIAPFSHEVTVPFSSTEAPGAPVRVDLSTGPGLNLIGVAIRGHLSTFSSWYTFAL
ncbi:hypothetical protein FK531_10925 [Rhodococcus spelaei]|uniref:Secreted protein n=1 Tax=Rhodococcus spelaei TaxID=2546320 RepID=A0A541BAJ4_9NOCA|nr:hypothetical protein [Rhodococcus spelaei]TQF69248.1 hypothetical protein FK531_10925 [Rhodococcus spelaei]